ncbi:MAG: ankyrin repeat domain-containing protein [Thermotogae bacterium]|nr:ankyrin repeat domain-containing protein [Thermotogota bacterium]
MASLKPPPPLEDVALMRAYNLLKMGRWEDVIRLIETNNLKAYDYAYKTHNTLTHYVCYFGSSRVLKVLMEKEYYPNKALNKTNLYGETPMHFAYLSGSEEVVDLALEYGGDPLMVTDDNLTVLHYAAAGGNPNLVAKALKFISVDAEDAQSRTPLYYAAKEQHKDVVKVLLLAGADPSKLPKDVRVRRVRRPKLPYDVIATLLETLFGTDKDKFLEIFEKYRGSKLFSVLVQKLSSYKLFNLFAYLANLKKYDDVVELYRITPFELKKRLLERALEDENDNLSKTLINLLIKYDRISLLNIVKDLTYERFKTIFNLIDTETFTELLKGLDPESLATFIKEDVLRGEGNLAKRLLEEGDIPKEAVMDILMKNLTVGELIPFMNFLKTHDMNKILKEAFNRMDDRLKVKLIKTMVKKDKESLIKYILDNTSLKVPITLLGYMTDKAPHVAFTFVEKDRVDADPTLQLFEIMKNLKGTHRSEFSDDDYNRGLNFFYTYMMVKTLLERGADASFREDFSGVTPLHIAAYEGHLGIVKLLIKYGADINSEDKLNYTPLGYALKRQHLDVVEYLKRLDAKV